MGDLATAEEAMGIILPARSDDPECGNDSHKKWRRTDAQRSIEPRTCGFHVVSGKASFYSILFRLQNVLVASVVVVIDVAVAVESFIAERSLAIERKDHVIATDESINHGSEQALLSNLSLYIWMRSGAFS